MNPKTIIIGNWKMNKTNKESTAFINEFNSLITNATLRENLVYGIASPATNYSVINEIKKSSLELVAQNCHFAPNGAYTGEISIAMLQELHIKYVIIGHSERRQYFNETDCSINKKLVSLLENNMNPILCVGETLDQFNSGDTNKIVENQLTKDLKNISNLQAQKIVIAYEPIWAIGTGKTATPEIAEKTCAFIRKTLTTIFNAEVANAITIQYGGSVKPANVCEILSQPNINGALVGGASLTADSFIKLITTKKD